VPYLAQLLAGYRTGLDHDPPESGEAVRAALTEEDDAYRRGILLGLLANSLVQPDRSSSKIGETTIAATRRDRSYTRISGALPPAVASKPSRSLRLRVDADIT
jgi:hypothetical protein